MAKKTKKELVDALIANKSTKWEEKHRDVLDKLADDQLELMIPNEAPAPPPAPVPLANQKELDDAAKKGVENAEGKKEEPKKELSLKEWLNSVPAEARPMITNALKFQEDEHKRIIGVILNSDRGKELYTQEELTVMDIPSLRKIQTLVAPAVSPENAELASYFGMANPVANSKKDEEKEEALPLPVYNYEKQPA
jgi:hypothetical protein